LAIKEWGFNNVGEPSRLSKSRQDACPTKIGCYNILIPKGWVPLALHPIYVPYFLREILGDNTGCITYELEYYSQVGLLIGLGVGSERYSCDSED